MKAVVQLRPLNAVKPTVASRGRGKNADYRTREHLAEPQIEKLVGAAGEGRNPVRDRLLVTMAFHHALGVSELVGLRWSQIDLKTGSIFVVRGKSGTPSTQGLRGDQLRLLHQLRAEKDLLDAGPRTSGTTAHRGGPAARDPSSGDESAPPGSGHAQQHERDAERRALWLERLKAAGALAPGLPAEERFRRIAQALASKHKIQVKDLTPELRSAADAYLTHVGEREIVPRSEFWLLNAGRRRGSEIDKHRMAALNHLVKNFRPAALPPARISISGSDHRYLDEKKKIHAQ